MKDVKEGRRKSWISKIVAGIGIAIAVCGLIMLLPAVVNYFMQPWHAAKMNIFRSLANVFGRTPVASLVDMSTSNVDKWAYAVIQAGQIASILVDELGLTKSEETKKLLHSIRVISYVIEIPINGLYSWWYFSEGAGADPNFITMICKVIVYTAAATLVFEGFIWLFCRLIKMFHGVFKDNHEHQAARTTVGV